MTQYAAPYDGYLVQPEGHSGLGIASFAIAMITGGLDVITIIIAAMMVASAPESMNEETPAAMAVGCTIMLGIVANVVGIGLGIGGVVQATRKKVFAVLGIVFNVAMVLGVCFLILLGSVTA